MRVVIKIGGAALEEKSSLRNCARAVVELANDAHTVAVVHGGVIGCLLAHASSATSFAFNGSDNASISELVVDGDRQVVRRFNDSAHLYG